MKVWISAFLMLCRCLSAHAQTLPPVSSRPVRFAQDIQPIFERSCYSCHGPEKQKSGFRLDFRTFALRGGENGPDILPGNSKDSPLVRYVSGMVEDMLMPPKGEPLTADQIGLLRAWIDQGAEWPADDPASGPKQRSDFWSFKPVQRPVVPRQSRNHWVRNEIDAFILERLDREKLSPSIECDRVTLIRRLSFDLIGLPPTPSEISDFVNDTQSGAYERVVERLLASPQYGERSARHWLDLIHFGETHGYDKDKPRLNAWPYRDYVICAFNSDKRYPRFIEEQIAGDILFPEDPAATIATGFLAAGPWDFVGHVELPETKTDGLIARYNDRDDMVMTVMSTFESLTVHCARCHDHKFDPITQRDYYALQAVFAGVDRTDRIYDEDPRLFQRRKALQEARAMAKDDPVKLKSVDQELKELPPARYVYAVTHDFPRNGSFGPATPVRPVHLLQRGDVKSPKELVDPAPLSCFSDLKAAFDWHSGDPEGQRRAALARWIAQPGNMLARRSIVNRIWEQHLGRGLVETPNDFGQMGAAPTHPQLLDWLACWFVEHGESIKELHRLILCSATYRQVSMGHPEFEKSDGDDRYYWRMTRQRLDAETFHDTLLRLSENLDDRMGGPSVQQFYFKDDHSPIYDYTRFSLDDPGARRRSIYRFVVRSVPDPFMESLDFPDCSLLTPKRTVTITALQALNGLNDPFVIRQAELWARNLARKTSGTSEQIKIAWQSAFSREPSKAELTHLVEYADKHGLANFCRLVFNMNEFLFID